MSYKSQTTAVDDLPERKFELPRELSWVTEHTGNPQYDGGLTVSGKSSALKKKPARWEMACSLKKLDQQKPVQLPPLSEQRAIAAALSDVDALIRGLDQLIAKKRDLKQANMQRLLTGKLRLPEFRGEWEVKNLGMRVPSPKAGASGKTNWSLAATPSRSRRGGLPSSPCN